MPGLLLPPCGVRVSVRGGRRCVFDPQRRRYVALTPEEWVRQHFVQYLVRYKGYPPSLIANEVEISVGGKRLRADTVLYDSRLLPRMVIEYKAPHVRLSQEVVSQIASYNSLLRAPYITVSNGRQHLCLRRDGVTGRYALLRGVPGYAEL